MDQESVHLKKRIAADAESIIFERRAGSQRLKYPVDGLRYPVHNIHLDFRLIGEQLNSGGAARDITFKFRDRVIQQRRRDGTLIYRAELVRAMLEVANCSAF